MADEEKEICPACGKSIGKLGSITQWIGLGEQCHCNSPKAALSIVPSRKQDNKCRRCLKPKPSAQQSMTQWLFKKDLCTCSKDKKSVEPIKIDLPSANPAGPKFNNILIIGGTIGAICLIVVAYSLIVFEVPNVLDSHKGGNDRRIVCSPTIQIPFDNAATSIITRNQYRYLTLKDCRIDDFELIQLGPIPSLEGMTLQNCRGYSDRGLLALAQNHQLKYLSLAQSPLSQAHLESLSVSKLGTLDLSRTGIADADWTCLTRIDSLKKLVLRDVFVTNKNRKTLEAANFNGSAGVFVR